MTPVRLEHSTTESSTLPLSHCTPFFCETLHQPSQKLHNLQNQVNLKTDKFLGQPNAGHRHIIDASEQYNYTQLINKSSLKLYNSPSLKTARGSSFLTTFNEALRYHEVSNHCIPGGKNLKPRKKLGISACPSVCQGPRPKCVIKYFS